MSGVKYAVSACLCGLPTRYDGQVKPTPTVIQRLLSRGEVLPVCPECLGGLPTPRPPAEICGERVINTAGVDVTAAYRHGAQQTLALCRQHGIRVAILKENSPSCGCHNVYDGSFTRRLVSGRGITAALLAEHGITVLNENEAETNSL